MSGSSSRGWPAMLVVALLVVGLDQLTKGAVRGSLEPGERADAILGFELVRVSNSGIAFGLLGDASSAIVLTVTAGALALLVGWFATDAHRPGLWLGVGLLVGGAVGNLIDRVRLDAVTDFLDPPLWPAFNVADVAITAGVVVLALTAFAVPAADEQPAPP